MHCTAPAGPTHTRCMLCPLRTLCTQGADKDAMRQLESAEFISGPISTMNQQQFDAALDANRWGGGGAAAPNVSVLVGWGLGAAKRAVLSSAACARSRARTLGSPSPPPCLLPRRARLLRQAAGEPAGAHTRLERGNGAAQGGGRQAAGSARMRAPRHALLGTAAMTSRALLSRYGRFVIETLPSHPLPCPLPTVQGVRSEQSPEPLRGEVAKLLWQELGAKCFYASTVSGSGRCSSLWAATPALGPPPCC